MEKPGTTAGSPLSASVGAMLKSPTSARARSGVGGQRVGRVLLQGAQPVELVEEVRVAEGAAVGHVETPDADAADRRADRARLLRRIHTRVILLETRHSRKGICHIGERLTTRDRDAVPLREPVRLDVEAGILELFVGELLGLALDLLHGQDVDRFAHREVDDPVDAGTDGVDVPRGKPHADKPTASRRRSRVRRGRSVDRPGCGRHRGPFRTSRRADAQPAAQRRQPLVNASTRARVRSGSPTARSASIPASPRAMPAAMRSEARCMRSVTASSRARASTSP